MENQKEIYISIFNEYRDKILSVLLTWTTEAMQRMYFRKC